MYKIKRFNSLVDSENKMKSVSDWIKDKSSSIYRSGKHAVLNPKETGTKAVRYVKDNPDEAIVLAGSNVIPAAMIPKLIKSGNKKAASIAATAAILPIGEAYVAGKLGYRKWKDKNKK